MDFKLDTSVDTKINTNTIVLLCIGIMIAGAFIVAVSRISKSVEKK